MRKNLNSFSLVLILLALMLPAFCLGQELPSSPPPDLPLQPPTGFSMPGRIEGTGTYFETKDSEYLNISLTSSQEIKVVIESVPRMISLNIKPAVPETVPSNLTIKGLEPNKTYYKYENSYKNLAVFVANENGEYSWQQDLSLPNHIWFQEEKSTVFMPGDCASYGVWGSATSTCTLTKDIIQSVEITEDNVVLDCDGYDIAGNGTGYGIYLSYQGNVTIKTCKIHNFAYGIYLDNSSNNNLLENDVNSNYNGVSLFFGDSKNNLIKNKIDFNKYLGLEILYSSENYLRENSIENNQYNLSIRTSFIQDIDTSNKINGKPIYYLLDKKDTIIDSSWNPGYIGIVNSTNISVKDLTISNNGEGILLSNTQNSRIENVNLEYNQSGICLDSASDNAIVRNVISNIEGVGILLSNSSNSNIIAKNNVSKSLYGIALGCAWCLNSNNTLTENNISDVQYSGIYLGSSANNTISKNIISNNGGEWGSIYIFSSSDNNVSENIISNNGWAGIYLSGWAGSGGDFPCSDNIINSNEISNNELGILIDHAPGNHFRNNSITNNKYNFRINGFYPNWPSYYRVSEYIQDIDISNTINRKPIYYLVNAQDQVIDATSNAGFVGVINSTNILIKDQILEDNWEGVLLINVTNSRIENISASSNDTGIGLYSCSGNDLTGNNTSGNGRGIRLDYSSGNNIAGNTVSSNETGVQLFSSSNNIITGNKIFNNNQYGLFQGGSYDDGQSNYNKVYNNNFIDNKQKHQVGSNWPYYGTGNLFDDGYPSGGNYFSDYTGQDLKSGPNQDQPSSDGIGDTPYIFTGGRDRYPFMQQDGWKVQQNQPPVCNIKLQNNGSPIDKINVSEFFDINLGESTSDVGINGVRFMSDELQNETTEGVWTDWFDWSVSSTDSENWTSDTDTKIARWSFATPGQKEVWAEVKDTNGLTSQCSANIEVVLPLVDVAVILAEPSDVSHESSSITAKPCKLLPEKIYSNGHSKEYYQDLVYCVTDYNKENSFGKINLNFEIIDDNGNWFKIPEEGVFIKKTIDLVKSKGIDLSVYDAIIIIKAKEKGDAVHLVEFDETTGQLISFSKIRVGENDAVGVWAHEVGHFVGAYITPENTATPDLYNMGNVGKWDVMAQGACDLIIFGICVKYTDNPSYMSSFTKEFLGWLNYNIHPKSAFGEYWINSLETSKLSDSIFRYNLSDDLNEDSSKYYILEARNKNLKTWDSSLPEDKALVLYYVDSRDWPKYGYDLEGRKMNIGNWEVGIPSYNLAHPLIIDDGILNPSTNDSYRDLDNLVKFSAMTDRTVNDKYGIQAKIEKITKSSFGDKFRGVILKQGSILKEKIKGNLHLEVSSEYHVANSFSAGFDILPDLDLHLYCDGGKHVGMNYETGKYEIQISDAMVSGDNQSSPEWIFIPPAITGCRFVVSSYDNQKFLDENPEIAQEIEDTTDSYEIYSRYIDPEADIYTSQVLTEQSINPGENIIHQTTGTTDISVSQGAVDSQGPVITHSELNPDYLLNSSAITFNFSALDEGVGVKEIVATLDSNPLTNGQNITFDRVGIHTIVINASDFLGNTIEENISFSVVYSFGGFLPPIIADGSGIYNQGRTLPVKFRLTDMNSNFVSNAVATITLAKISNNIFGDEEVPLSTSNADVGNIFRYDLAKNQYIFNLSTKNLSLGSWQLKVKLNDGISYDIIIAIRK